MGESSTYVLEMWLKEDDPAVQLMSLAVVVKVVQG